MFETVMMYAATKESYATEESAGIFTSLGIDGQMFLFQLLGFVLLLFILSRWVFPIFMKIVDEREEKIESSLKAAHEAEKNAENAHVEVEKLLDEARNEAKNIVALAKEGADQVIEDANQKAKQDAERMLKSAKSEIEKEVLQAQKALRNEMVSLVALATEKVTLGVYSDKLDEKMIAKTLESTSVEGVK